jgi:hypothetical protein
MYGEVRQDNYGRWFWMFIADDGAVRRTSDPDYFDTPEAAEAHFRKEFAEYDDISVRRDGVTQGAKAAPVELPSAEATARIKQSLA